MKQRVSKANRLDTLVEENAEGSNANMFINPTSTRRGSTREDAIVYGDDEESDEKDDPTPQNEEVEPQNTDETLRLFECMPKGFANFLEFGPCRRVSDSMDYEKMCILQAKKLDYLKEKQIPLTCRARGIHEKVLELQNHIKNFEPLIEEVDRKTTAAKKVFQQAAQANREMLNELPKAKLILELEMKKRDAIIERVIKYEKVNEFIERLLKLTETQFDSFSAIMDRNQTLISTNKYLMRRYLTRHMVQEKLVEEVQAVNELERTHSIFLRHELTHLKKELAAKARANMDMEQKCILWSEMMTDRLLTLFKLKMCINNMAECIVRVRPYVARKMEGVVESGDQIHAIGGFIVDYTDIMKKLKHAKRRISITLPSRSSRNNHLDD